MQRMFWLLAIMLVLALALVACDKDEDDETPSSDSGDSSDDDTPSDDDDDDDDTPAPLVGMFEFDMTLEVDFQATLRLKQFADDTLVAALIPDESFDVLAAGSTLSGAGKILRFPEAHGHMLMLKLQGPAITGGKCGDAPLSYSVTLTCRDGNYYYVGGFTAYCGEAAYTGRAARVMRLSGIPTAVD